MGLRVPGLPIILTLIILLMLVPAVYALPSVAFAKTCGGPNDDVGRGVVISSTKDIYVGGYTGGLGSNPSNATGVLLLKYNSMGNIVWQRTWGGGVLDEAYKVTLDGTGSIYLAGTTASFTGDLDALILKYSSDGTLLWARTWGKPGIGNKDVAYGIVADNPGNALYVTGVTNSFGNGTNQLFLLKLDANGTLIWQRIWNGTKVDWGFDVAVNKYSQIYVAGYTESFGAGAGDALLLNFDSAGNLLDTATWGGTGFDQARGISIDPSGYIYVAGRTQSLTTGSSSAFLLKYTPTLFLQWQRAWGGTGDTEGAGVTVSNNNTYMTGLTNIAGAGGRDAFLLKFSSLTGTLLLQNVWGGTKDDFGYGVAVDPSENALLTGFVSEAPPYTLTTPNTASVTTTLTTGSPFGTLYTPNGVMNSPSGVITMPACSTFYAGGKDLFLLKLALAPLATSNGPLIALPVLLTIAAIRFLALRSTKSLNTKRP